MKFKIFCTLFLLVYSIGSQGIIIRHDVAPGEYEVSSNELPAVFFLERQGIRRVCAATVIHERWAITAAHCINETMLGNTIENDRRFAVEVGNQTREIDAVLLHPDITNILNPEVDLALLRFRHSSPTPRPVRPYTENNEEGEVVTLVGWGYFGLGTTGRQFDNGTKRQAQNRISSANSKLRFVFNDPRDRSQETLPLEGTLGLGDSGGPALIDTGGEYRLAGVAIGEMGGTQFSEETQGKYGSIAVYERISRHIDWIQFVIGSES